MSHLICVWLIEGLWRIYDGDQHVGWLSTDLIPTDEWQVAWLAEMSADGVSFLDPPMHQGHCAPTDHPVRRFERGLLRLDFRDGAVVDYRLSRVADAEFERLRSQHWEFW